MGIKRNSYKETLERTILLKDVIRIDTNEIVTDHLWFTVRKRFKELNLRAGDVISFSGRVSSYKKGYYHNIVDYHLKYPSKIVVEHRTTIELNENEITSATIPTWNEYFDVVEKKNRSGTSIKSNDDIDNKFNDFYDDEEDEFIKSKMLALLDN